VISTSKSRHRRGQGEALVVLLFIAQTACAQYELSLTGYVVDLPVYQRMNELIPLLTGGDRDQILNVTRIRLRPTMTLWENARLEFEYEMTASYHSSVLLMSLQQDEPRRQVVKLTWQVLQEEHVTLLHFVDRLAFTQRSGNTEFVIGRQRISWGTGRIWNPTDLFNPLNPTSFAKIEKDGVDAVSSKIFLGEFTDVTLVLNPQRNSRGNGGGRFRTNFREFDLSLVGGVFDDRTIIGSDFAGNVLKAGVRGEGILSMATRNSSDRFVKYILGIDYQFTPEFYLLAEYHYNGEGSTDRLRYDLPKLLKGDILNLGRDYLAVSGSYLLHPLVTASATVMVNLNDESRFQSVTVSYSVSEDWTMALGGQLVEGDEMDEYWYYPNSLFVKVEAYF
jgi:hypothetical protein